MIAEFKAPYAIALIIIIVVSALVMIIHGSIDSTAFKVAALLAGGMVARGLLASQRRCPQHCLANGQQRHGHCRLATLIAF